MIAMAEYFVATVQWIRLFCRIDDLFINRAVKRKRRRDGPAGGHSGGFRMHNHLTLLLLIVVIVIIEVKIIIKRR